MKTNGKTWNDYMDSWPEGQWFDDSNETCNGKEMPEQVSDTDVIEFSEGVVFPNPDSVEGVDLVRHFKAWLKTRSIVRVLVEVDVKHQEALTAFLKTVKGKVVS